MLYIRSTIKRVESIDNLRLVNYNKNVGGKMILEPQYLGLTSNTTAQHSLRVYYQVQVWKGKLLYYNGGFMTIIRRLMPVLVKKFPAPAEMLNIIRHSCKVEYIPH